MIADRNKLTPINASTTYSCARFVDEQIRDMSDVSTVTRGRIIETFLRKQCNHNVQTSLPPRCETCIAEVWGEFSIVPPREPPVGTFVTLFSSIPTSRNVAIAPATTDPPYSRESSASEYARHSMGTSVSFTQQTSAPAAVHIPYHPWHLRLMTDVED